MKDNIARLLEYINCHANPRTFGAFLLLGRSFFCHNSFLLFWV